MSHSNSPHGTPRRRVPLTGRGFISTHTLGIPRRNPFDTHGRASGSARPQHATPFFMLWVALLGFLTIACGIKAFTSPTSATLAWDLAFIGAAVAFLTVLVHVIWLQARREIGNERLRGDARSARPPK